MRILVLGGTEFVGRALVDEAVGRGHEVTTLNRGTKTPEQPQVTARHGDRRQPGGLDALTGEWDVVIDTWSSDSYVVSDSVEALKNRVGRYLFVSTRSVYEFPAPVGADESAPLLAGDPEAGRDGAEVPYGEAKRGSEIAVERGFGDRYVHVRAGLILGPWENIGRLPWWLGRVARGGDVLAPGPDDLPLQYVDARDLAIWTVGAAEQGLSGAFDMISPPGHTSMGEFLRTCVEVTGSDAELRWAPPELIDQAGIEPWTELPVWIPPGPEHAALHLGNPAKALATGLYNRPVAETVGDTWAWLQSIGGQAPQRPDRPQPGLDPEKEAGVLKTLMS
ncbi:NAD-dependent epimerase/dehydratase family protein [Kineosporia sp. NBRC 101731]|uniref:NAD-dependent epimerase/dehydratase family protein n=1 Tax=Kineosporia sp. NBRC 101731 TaxID=3032199 RepID=UPI00255520F3|nr:NAD-dependent epimerase/dehydratase family protein [Kineosporia sp. NBRC 101731]